MNNSGDLGFPLYLIILLTIRSVQTIDLNLFLDQHIDNLMHSIILDINNSKVAYNQISRDKDKEFIYVSDVKDYLV